MEDLSLYGLSEQQDEFFKDTAIIGKDGKPEIRYHTTNGELFDEIDPACIGSNQGIGYGPYFYTAADCSDCGRYGAEDGSQTMAVFLDIRNPLMSDTFGTISDSQLLEILARVDPDGKLGISMKDKVVERTKEYEENRLIRGKAQDENAYEPPELTKLPWLFKRTALRNAQERAVYDITYSAQGEIEDYLKIKYLYDAVKKAIPNLNAVEWNRTVAAVTGYDGFVKMHEEEREQVCAFFPEQVKSITNREPQRDNKIFGKEGKASVKDIEEAIQRDLFDKEPEHNEEEMNEKDIQADEIEVEPIRKPRHRDNYER